MTAERKSQAGGSLHVDGGDLWAGGWGLAGAAEAPTKLVNAGFSPFAISLCMVAGVFTARWTFPTLLKGTSYVFADLMAKKHLIVWAILAGALWAVANTLTVFAIRDVGLATAFPLWNTNSLIGLLWGRLLFKELGGGGGEEYDQGGGGGGVDRDCGDHAGVQHDPRGQCGGSACGARADGGGWGEPDVGDDVCALPEGLPERDESAFVCDGVYGGGVGDDVCADVDAGWGSQSSAFQLAQSGGLLFWLFLGGFVWVVGDLFQQFATKVSGDRAGDSAFEYESALGAGVGGAGVWGVGYGG